jgi:cation/acetate symporter
MERWTLGILETGIDPQGVGTLGMLLNLTVTLALTRLCPPPSEKTRQLIDSIREPEAAGPAVRIEQSISH